MCLLPSPKSGVPRSPIRPRSYQVLQRSHRPNVRDHDQSKQHDLRQTLILHAGIRPSPSSGPLSTGSPFSDLDQSPVRLGLCRYRSRSSGNCLGTISDRQASNRDLPAANPSGKPSHSAWFPRLAATDPFRELLFPDAPGAEWALDFDGSPTTLLESSLHAELGVDAAYAARSSDRSLVDGEGRRPLYFPLGGLARLPSHRGYGASVALPLGSWISSQWIHFYRTAFLYGPMEASGSGLMGDNSVCLELICSLRHSPPAGGTQWLLPIQSTATAFILRCHFRHGPAVHVDRNSDVSGG